jgi:hypothetical protein
VNQVISLHDNLLALRMPHDCHKFCTSDSEINLNASLRVSGVLDPSPEIEFCCLSPFSAGKDGGVGGTGRRDSNAWSANCDRHGSVCSRIRDSSSEVSSFGGCTELEVHEMLAF